MLRVEARPSSPTVNDNSQPDDAQQAFKIKLQKYQSKVKVTIDGLIAERAELKKRVSLLEELLKENGLVPENVEEQDEVESLREQLAEQASLVAEMRERLAAGNALNAAYKQQLDQLTSAPKHTKEPTSAPSTPSPSPSPPSVESPSIKERKSGNWSLSRLTKRESVVFSSGDLATLANGSGNGSASNSPLGGDKKRGSSGSQNMIVEEDTEEEVDRDIVLTKNTANNLDEVKGGTLQKLVERLSYHKVVDTSYVTAFLLTYRSFTTPMQLFELLVQRYDFPNPQVNDNDAQQTEKYEAMKKIVKLRVGNVLKSWLSDYFSDFSDNAELLTKVTDFINNTLARDMEQLASFMRKYLTGERDQSQLIMTVPDPPASLVPKSASFIDFEPLEVARQLTLIEHFLFRSIRPGECLNKSWSSEDRETSASNVMEIIRRFNLVSTWVATEIVKKEKLNERVQVVKNFIKIAQECWNMNNFNGVMEILAGLQNSAIYRLKKTWEKVESSKQNDMYQELLGFMSSNENYKLYRAKLRQITPPCLPFLGMYLTDLTFLEDGNPNSLNNRDELINFDKRYKVATVIKDIQQHQLTPYNYREESVIRTYLNGIEGLTEKALFKYSLLCEPRGRDSPQAASNKTLLRKFKFEG